MEKENVFQVMDISVESALVGYTHPVSGKVKHAFTIRVLGVSSGSPLSANNILPVLEKVVSVLQQKNRKVQ